jgi:hypothetical protein
MTLRCSRAPEVLDLLTRGHWPLACPPELRTHLDTCRFCAELIVVTQAFQKSRTATSAQAQLPPPGVLWWRAQLRRRNAAVERVGRPILGAYVFAFAILVLVAIAFVVSQVRHGLGRFDSLGQSSLASALQFLNPATSTNSGWSLLVLLPILATVILISAVVVYVTTERQ